MTAPRTTRRGFLKGAAGVAGVFVALGAGADDGETVYMIVKDPKVNPTKVK